jgi:hypothetical protein
MNKDPLYLLNQLYEIAKILKNKAVEHDIEWDGIVRKPSLYAMAPANIVRDTTTNTHQRSLDLLLQRWKEESIIRAHEPEIVELIEESVKNYLLWSLEYQKQKEQDISVQPEPVIMEIMDYPEMGTIHELLDELFEHYEAKDKWDHLNVNDKQELDDIKAQMGMYYPSIGPLTPMSDCAQWQHSLKSNNESKERGI